MYVILEDDPPTLSNPDQWSFEFNDFVRLCLLKDPLDRPSALDLLLVRSCEAC